MANMIMASSKTLIPPPSPSPPKPKFQFPHLSLPKFPSPQVPKLPLPLSSSLKTLTAIAAASLASAPPSLAEEFEKAALFDFDLTLPIVMAEFLFLMFALDKLYYSPLGKVMDDRDAMIKEQLAGVKDSSEELKQLEEQAEAMMRAARAEIAAALNKAQKEAQEELEVKLAEGKMKVEKELEEALENLEKEQAETIKYLDAQIKALSEDIVKKVIPA
jgi:F-type H+-transporting ATPase subunit b